MKDELLDYYDRHKRDLPWRKNKDPYSIWISEIICQQTRVDTAIDYYLNFMKDYPTVSDLARTSEDELFKHWQGLGYYLRARNLHKAARVISDKYNGIFPGDYETILSLPGIGEYTASAISSMAYNLPYVAIDGNFLRVFTRFYEIEEDISKPVVKSIIKEKLLPLLSDRPGDFNQAVMDLGAGICLGNTMPKCDDCPLQFECLAHLHHKESDYPVNLKKTKVKFLQYTVFLIETGKGIVLHKRKDNGLLASLYEFPNVQGFLDINTVRGKFQDASIEKKKPKSHHFSHQTWTMECYCIKTDFYVLKENEFFASKKEIQEIYSIPRCFNQFFEYLDIE